MNPGYYKTVITCGICSSLEEHLSFSADDHRTPPRRNKSIQPNLYNTMTTRLIIRQTLIHAISMEFVIAVQMSQDIHRSKEEGGIRVCGDAVLLHFWCGFVEIFILR